MPPKFVSECETRAANSKHMHACEWVEEQVDRLHRKATPAQVSSFFSLVENSTVKIALFELDAQLSNVAKVTSNSINKGNQEIARQATEIEMLKTELQEWKDLASPVLGKMEFKRAERVAEKANHYLLR